MTIYTLSGIWQHVGWSSILYIAVLSSIDPQLHEAATIDGASRLQRIWFINIPALMPMVMLRLIMSVGGILNVGFEKAYLLQTPLNLDKSQIISTYMYEVSLGSIIQDYSYGTAVGLFNNVINVILMISANWLAKKAKQETIW